VTSAAVVTHEGSFLRARANDDGSLLWAMPVQTIPRMAARRHLASARRPRLVVTEHQARHPWIWLRRYGSGSVDAFIHSVTGRIVSLTDALHLTADNLVLTKTGDLLGCYALPRESAVTPSPSAHAADP
jgi:hypothetical protein